MGSGDFTPGYPGPPDVTPNGCPGFLMQATGLRGGGGGGGGEWGGCGGGPAGVRRRRENGNDPSPGDTALMFPLIRRGAEVPLFRARA